MNIEQAREYTLTLPGVTEDMPYGPDWLIFRFGGKIFMHIWLESPIPRIAVKLPPEEGEELRERYDAITPAYHLNKTHWNRRTKQEQSQACLLCLARRRKTDRSMISPSNIPSRQADSRLDKGVIRTCAE